MCTRSYGGIANRASGRSHAARSDCEAPIGPDSIYCGGSFYRKMAMVSRASSPGSYLYGQVWGPERIKLDRHPNCLEKEERDECDEVGTFKSRRGLSALEAAGC